MVVFVLLQAWDYGGEDLRGVFASIASAQDAARAALAWMGDDAPSLDWVRHEHQDGAWEAQVSGGYWRIYKEPVKP